MALQEKSMYVFQLNATYDEIVDLIEDWLADNHFEKMEDADGVYYQTHKRFMEYVIEGNTLTLYVYIRSRKKPVGMENGVVGMVEAMSYLNILTPLFTELGLRAE